MTIFIISWTMFCITFGLMLLFSFIMGWQGLHFYTKDVVVKKFSIMDLEMPATPRELVNLIRGLYKLPRPDAIRSIRSLRCQLYTDFLFMPCAYTSIFILCMLVSAKMELHAGTRVFVVLAWLQAVPWLCDIIENIYLLRKIKPKPVLSTKAFHKAYLGVEYFKWGITLVASICSIAALCYFWLARSYDPASLYYLLVIAAEIILFFVLAKLFLKNKKEEL